jgi:uncharacterized protein YbjT (DUF2867 family)
MRFVITGSLGNVGKPLAAQLRDAGHAVTVVSSKSDRTASIEALGASAAIGTVEDANFLAGVFKGADGIFTMVPPHFGGHDWKSHIGGIGRSYLKSILASGVKYVVNLSSIGAHMREGCGPVSGLYRVEQALNELPGVNVRHLRAGFFYTNFLNSVGLIRHQGIISGNYGKHARMVLAHPTDIADAAAKELQGRFFQGKGYSYVASDELTTDQIASIIGRTIGKPDLAWVDLTDKDALDGMIKAGLSEDVARNYVEMGTAIRSGDMWSDYEAHRPVLAGWRRFESFAEEEFAAAYAAS